MTSTSETPPFVRQFLDTVPEVRLADIIPEPERGALVSADMINGFLREGPLSSPRVNGLTVPVVNLVQAAWDHGIRTFAFMQDTHSRNTPEFQSYPPHSIAGTSESQMIPELARLPFASSFSIIEKNSLNPAIDTTFDAWWDQHREITTAIAVGNCTDLCVYQLAMHMRMRANALNLHDFTVVVPMNAVDTFDIPDHDGQTPGDAHPGDFFHEVFLYHMASNGVRIVRSIA